MLLVEVLVELKVQRSENLSSDRKSY